MSARHGFSEQPFGPQQPQQATAAPPKANGHDKDKDDWPKPEIAAYHGLAGEVVTALLPHTESDPVALLVQYLASFGNVIGRGPYFQVESDQHFGNIFAILVGRILQVAQGHLGRAHPPHIRHRRFRLGADADLRRHELRRRRADASA